MSDRRKMVRTALRGAIHPRSLEGAVAGDGLLGAFGDDILLMLLQELASLDADLQGSEWQEQRREKTRDAARFGLTCWRVRNALIGDTTKGGSLYAELLARGATDVEPIYETKLDQRPYLSQLRQEERSQHQLRAMVVLDEELGFHCAGSCCEHAREAANRRLQRHKSDKQIVNAALKRAWMVAPVLDHPTKAYAYVNHTGIVLLHGTDVVHTLHPRDYGLWGHEPHVMSASPDGLHVAFTVWGELDTGEDVSLWVWTPALGLPPSLVVVRDEFESALNLGDAVAAEATKPTAFWWTDNNELRVAWTSVFVTRAGTDGAGGQYPDFNDFYVFGTYDIDPDNGAARFVESLIPDTCNGSLACQRLISVSPDESGRRLACLVRVTPMRKRDTHYKVFIYNHEQEEVLSHPQVWKGVDPYGKDGFDWGPSAVGMSPAGDCVVVVHRTAGSCVTEIFEHSDGSRFARVNAHNVSDWLRGVTPEDVRTGSNIVKLRYKVGFSACGRFAHVIDQRAYHRYYFEGHAAAILDLSQRRMSQQIPVRGLCHYEAADFEFAEEAGLSRRVTTPTPVRELFWGKDTVWALATRGIVSINSASSS